MSRILETTNERVLRIHNQLVYHRLTTENGMINGELTEVIVTYADIQFLLSKTAVSGLLEEENRTLQYRASESVLKHMNDYIRVLEKENRFLRGEIEKHKKRQGE